VDDSFRHAITKLSHMHFVTTAEAQRRVLQLGEAPERVFLTGSPGLDRIRMTSVLDRPAFFKAVGLPAYARNLMITFHPETLARDTLTDCREMLAALDRLGPDVGLIFSGTNADVAGATIGALIADFVRDRANAVLHSSLGSTGYFSALTHTNAVVGNSSSGIYEAASFGTPTVNVGDRQKGRARAVSVIDVAASRDEIYAAILRAMDMDCSNVVNPYGDGHAAEKIIAAITSMGDLKQLVRKRFTDQAP
jgi:UDP-hydrolysing UDP-N-acetyl-D-glucosamine 2-epimerase